MSELMDCDIEIEMTMPQLREVFGAAKIYADDGVRTTIETKGHGMQRSMIFTILRAYAELTHVQKAGEKAEERTTIFAIELPKTIIKIVEKLKDLSYTEGIFQKARKELYEGNAAEDGGSMSKSGSGTALTQSTLNDISY